MTSETPAEIINQLIAWAIDENGQVQRLDGGAAITDQEISEELFSVDNTITMTVIALAESLEVPPMVLGSILIKLAARVMAARSIVASPGPEPIDETVRAACFAHVKMQFRHHYDGWPAERDRSLKDGSS